MAAADLEASHEQRAATHAAAFYVGFIVLAVVRGTK